MSRKLTASDRSRLIRLASTMEKGSEERKAILAGLKGASTKTASFKDRFDEWLDSINEYYATGRWKLRGNTLILPQDEDTDWSDAIFIVRHLNDKEGFSRYFETGDKIPMPQMRGNDPMSALTDKGNESHIKIRMEKYKNPHGEPTGRFASTKTAAPDYEWWGKNGRSFKSKTTRALRLVERDPKKALKMAEELYALMDKHGYPDNWHRVQRLKEDAEHQIRMQSYRMASLEEPHVSDKRASTKSGGLAMDEDDYFAASKAIRKAILEISEILDETYESELIDAFYKLLRRYERSSTGHPFKLAGMKVDSDDYFKMMKEVGEFFEKLEELMEPWSETDEAEQIYKIISDLSRRYRF